MVAGVFIPSCAGWATMRARRTFVGEGCEGGGGFGGGRFWGFIGDTRLSSLKKVDNHRFGLLARRLSKLACGVSKMRGACQRLFRETDCAMCAPIVLTSTSMAEGNAPQLQ
jgi:hypothetical protein